MPTTTKDGLLEAWAEQLEALEQNLESVYGPPGITPTLPAITNYDGMLEAIAGETRKALINFAKLNNAYNVATDDAYALELPATMMEFAKVAKIGGKTILFNQLIQNGNFADGTTGWSGITSNSYSSVTASNGVLTVVSTGSTTRVWGGSTNVQVQNGHKYLLRGVVRRDYDGADSDGNVTNIRIHDADNNSQTLISLATKTVGGVYPVNIVVTATMDAIKLSVVTNGTIPSQRAGREFFSLWSFFLIDLTQMFGTGNEPATAEECKVMFPADYYKKSSGELMNAGVTQVISKNTDGNVIDTMPVPAEVQALEGYGLSCPGTVNYIDYDTKKFVQNVGARDYEAGDESDATVITDGTTTNYALDTPVETDISEYLTDTDIVAVAGGTLLFPNANGSDYNIPVPVQTEYVGL